MRGRKPKSAAVKRVTGNPGKRRIPKEVIVDGAPVKPRWLTGRGAEIWKELLGIAYWLTRADSYVMAAWCDREAHHENPRNRAKWKAADRREHTSMASELGLTSSGRTRLAVKDPAAAMRGIADPIGKDPSGGNTKSGGSSGKVTKDPASKYLN